MVEIEKKLPFQVDCACTINASGAISGNSPFDSSTTDKLASFVKSLSKEEFSMLCFFRPNKTNDTEVVCRMPHKKINPFFINCFRGNIINKKLATVAMRKHLSHNTHQLSDESRKDKTVIICGKSKISLTQMVILKLFLFKIVLICYFYVYSH